MSTIALTAIATPTRTARRITVTQVRDLLEIIASSEPGRVDRRRDEDPPSLRYTRDGRPHGLVARVLAELGFGMAILDALDAEHPLGDLFNVGAPVATSRHPALRKLDPHARALLAFCQERQDSGATWSRILLAATRKPRWWSFGADHRNRPWL